MPDKKQITTTKHFNLDLPPYGTPDWHIFVNLNFKKIDDYVNTNLETSTHPIVSEEGAHGVRYWLGRLEYLSVDENDTIIWLPILVNGEDEDNKSSMGVMVASSMPEQFFGEFWYKVQAGVIEENDNTGDTSIFISSTMPDQTFGEFWYEVNTGIVEEGGIYLDDRGKNGTHVVVSETHPPEKEKGLWLDLD